MGRTFRGLRRKFGSKKTQEHRTRSKWNAQNGTRLRTLATDLAEFQEIVGPEFESLHRPPDLSEKTEKRLSKVIDVIIAEKKPRASETPKSNNEPKQSKNKQFQWLNTLTTSELQAKKDYAATQVRHLHRVIAALSNLDSSYAPARNRFVERRRYWDKQTGLIGPILVARGV
jgi:hypothetical protein